MKTFHHFDAWGSRRLRNRIDTTSGRGRAFCSMEFSSLVALHTECHAAYNIGKF